jgi:hypothetical protein
VRHDSAIQTDGACGVTPTAEIASEGLGNYVKLVTRILFTIAGSTTWLFVHSESRKPSGFQDLAILPPTPLSPKKKLKNARGPNPLGAHNCEVNITTLASSSNCACSNELGESESQWLTVWLTVLALCQIVSTLWHFEATLV